MKKKLSLLMVAFMAVAAFAVQIGQRAGEDEWTIAGAPEVLGTHWDVADTQNNMESTDGITWTLVKEGVKLKAGSYEFKVVLNHSWDNTNYGKDGSNKDNAAFSVAEDGVYTVTFTFVNDDTHALSAVPVKTGEYEAPADVYTVAGAPAALFGQEWAPTYEANDMELVDGLYTWAKSDIELSKGNVQFKVTKDHSWSTAYPSDNYVLPILADGKYNVTITFNAESKEVKAVAEPQDELPNAEIAKVQICGATDAEWQNRIDFDLTKGEGDVYTGEWDATAYTDDVEFKLVVNDNNWIGVTGLTIEAAEGLVDETTNVGDGKSYNFILKNADSGFKTYTVTATWEANPDASKNWTLKIEGKDARPVPATDVTIELAEGGDIYAALAAAEEGKTVGNISIKLAAGQTYTVSAPLVAYKNLEIQANGATIDATELTGNLIEMAATAEAPAEAVNIEYVSIHNATVKGLKKPLFYSTQKGYLINWLTIKNSIIEVAADVTSIDFTKGSAARNVNIENSTIYAPVATTKSFYSSQAGQKLTELDETGVQTFIVKNSTMYNLAVGKNFFTHRQANQKWLAYNVENSLFVNCGKSGQVIKGMNGGQSGTNPTWTITGNAFNFEAEGVMTDTSAAEDTGDTTEGEGVQNSVAGVVTFTDAANGDFNGEFQLAEGATAPESLGDGRWTITFKGGAEVETTYYLVGTFNNWTASDDYKLTLNENANEGVVEYMLTLDIPANSSMKVLDNIGNWYPATGPDFVVNDEGNFTVYFRPNADGDEFWFEGCIYCQYNGEPSGINLVKADDLKNAEIFNLNGQRVQNAQKGLYIVNGKKVVIK